MNNEEQTQTHTQTQRGCLTCKSGSQRLQQANLMLLGKDYD